MKDINGYDKYSSPYYRNGYWETRKQDLFNDSAQGQWNQAVELAFNEAVQKFHEMENALNQLDNKVNKLNAMLEETLTNKDEYQKFLCERAKEIIAERT